MTLYEKLIYEDTAKNTQIRLTVSMFNDIEYLSIRKYYQDFDENWLPTPDGVSFPISIDNSVNLFKAISDILSLAETDLILNEAISKLRS